MAEYESSGIWVVEPFGLFRHGMIEHRTLRLPDDLARGFVNWIEEYWKILDAPSEFDSIAFNDEGRRLARTLKRHVGSATDVLYTPIGADGNIDVEEHIE